MMETFPNIAMGDCPVNDECYCRVESEIKRCDPCSWCRNVYDDSDESVGMYGCSCRAADDGYEVFDKVRPCPYFQPMFASDGLFDQLFNEQEAEWDRMKDDAPNF